MAAAPSRTMVSVRAAFLVDIVPSCTAVYLEVAKVAMPIYRKAAALDSIAGIGFGLGDMGTCQLDQQFLIDAAISGLKLLQKSGFVLKLPQGTGKSLVSQLIVRSRLDSAEAPKTKALVIAPTVELRKQYARLGDWFRLAGRDSPSRKVV